MKISPKNSHSICLKNRILARMGGVEANNRGKEVRLALKSSIGELLANIPFDYDNEEYLLTKAAKIIRRDVTITYKHSMGGFN